MSANDASSQARPSDPLSPGPKPLSSSSGWLTSSDAIDHGRFAPGVVLDGRYRIIERTGRGGMGEVYRADDLRLAQPVALKFLPEAVDRDAVRLSQLHAEVRMARQVSHPNVCRVYDVEGFEGHTFLAMEYVDGEDLASLLRRIGRFPQDRAIELARQICAGLAAAHDRGADDDVLLVSHEPARPRTGRRGEQRQRPQPAANRERHDVRGARSPSSCSSSCGLDCSRQQQRWPRISC